MQITKLKGAAITGLCPTPDDVDMTAPLSELIAREVDRWHGEQPGILQPAAESDDVPTMVRHGHYGAALHLLIGATDLPLWEAIAEALWFNGRRDVRAVIAADWEAWCAQDIAHHDCEACGSNLWEVDPDDYVCHACLHHHRTLQG